MSRIRIVKKNDEYTSEYQVGDLFEITGTWYGGVHIMGKSGAPVSLDKEEYVELDTEPELKQEEVIPRDIRVGDIVQHFKREWVSDDFCHDKRTVYQNYRTASEQSGTGEACDESESYADSTGILRVSALSFHAVYGQKSVALAGDTRSGSVLRGTFRCPENHQCAKTV